MKRAHGLFVVVLVALGVGCGWDQGHDPGDSPSVPTRQVTAKLKAGEQTVTVTLTQTVTDTQTYTATSTGTVSASSTRTQTGTGTVSATSTRTTTSTAIGTFTRTTSWTSTGTATRTEGTVQTYNQIYVLPGTVTSSNTATVYYTQWAHSKGNTATATTTQYVLATASKAVTATVTSTFNGTETKTVSATMTGSGTSTGTTTVTVTATMTSASFSAGGGGRTVTATGTATNTATQSWTYHITSTLTRTLTNTGVATVTGTNTLTGTSTVTTTPTVTTTSTVTVTTTSVGTVTVTNSTTSTRTTTSTATQTAVSLYTVTPTALDFGTVGTGATSIPQNLTIQSTSAEAQPVPAVQFNGSHYKLSPETSSCSQLGSIASGQTCTYAIFFDASIDGLVTESLTVGGTTVSLSGTGVPPAWTVTPTALDFGTVGTGATSIPQNLTIQNVSGGWHAVPVVQFNGSHYKLSPETSTCSQLGSIASGQTCTYAIFFDASIDGLVTESLTVGGTTVSLSGTGVPPSWTVTPTALDFGTVGTGATSIPQNLTIQNTSGGWHAVPVVQFNGSHYKLSPETSTCSQLGSIASGQTCTYAIFFDASIDGLVTESLTVGGTTVSLSGTGVPPSWTVTPTALDFGTVGTGATSIPQNLTIQNTSGGWHAVPVVQFNGSHYKLSPETSTCSQLGSIASGQTCTYAIFFDASIDGLVTESLTVGGTTVSLSGTGVPPSWTVTPTALDFGTVGTGATSIPQNLTIQNVSGGWHAVPVVQFNGSHYKLSPETSTCSQLGSIASGQTCTYAIFFDASIDGLVTESLTVGGTTVSLSGIGVPPSWTVTPTALDFGTVGTGATSIPQNLTIQNTSGGWHAVPAVQFNGSHYKLSPETSTCSQLGSIASGQTCTYAIFFDASIDGLVTESLTVGGTTVSLSGTGVPPSWTVTPTALDFGTVGTGATSIPQNLTIQNTSGGWHAVPVVQFNGSHYKLSPETSTCSQLGSIASGQTCTYAIFFDASIDGLVTESLTVGGTTVSLSGIGVPPSWTVTPTALDFGTVGTGATSIPQNLTIQNTSGGWHAVPVVQFNGSHYKLSPETSTCSQLGSIASGQTCTYAIFFDASIDGLVTESLTVGGTTVSLSGIGVPPSWAVTPTALDFGSVVVGATSIPQNLTIQNTSGGWHAVPVVQFNGSHYKLSPETSTCSQLGSIASGQTCTYAIFFDASIGGLVTESLTVGGTTVSLSGTGVLGP